MKKLLSLFALCFSFSLVIPSLAHADATADCSAQSAAKKLAGAAKSSFEKKCMADAGAAPSPAAACEKASADKKLAGAAKASFEKKCLADAGAAPSPAAACGKASADKKLAGAAKASFEKKCIADAAGDKKAGEPKLVETAKKSDAKK